MDLPGGHLSGLLNFTPTGSIDPTMPILMLAIIFGLSMDYEVFLLSRVRERYDVTGDNAAAVASGLQRTGGIITSLALLLVIVVGAFSASGITFIKLLGIGMIIALVVDATIIRVLLVPATMRLLGRANWWAPRPLRQLYSRYGIRKMAGCRPRRSPPACRSGWGDPAGPRLPGGRRAWAGSSLPVAEAIPEPAEQPAFPGQGLGRWRRGRALAGDGLVVVGPRDGVDHLLLGEVLGALDLGDVADEVSVLHDLGLEPGRAVSVPFRYTPVRQGHPHPELKGADFGEVRVDATVAKRVGDPAGPILLHCPKIRAAGGYPGTIAGAKAPLVDARSLLRPVPGPCCGWMPGPCLRLSRMPGARR
jgi:hypothetical protein